MGTAQYLSPEQAKGAQVAAPSDLYSVGIVLSEMLTGDVPFTGDTPVEIAMKHLNEAPPPPSAIAPGIPADLDRVVLRALAKDPHDRYQSAEEFDSDLARIEAGLPIASETTDAATAVLAAAAGAGAATQVLRPRETAKVPPARRPPPPGDPYDEPPRKKRSILPWIIVLILLAGAGIAGWYVYQRVSDAFADQQPVPVPNVVGIEKKLAVGAIERANLKPKVKETTSDTVPSGIVIDQNPRGGTRISKGETVLIAVSTGIAQVNVPQVTGKTVTDAIQILKDAGLDVQTKGSMPTSRSTRSCSRTPTRARASTRARRSRSRCPRASSRPGARRPAADTVERRGGDPAGGAHSQRRGGRVGSAGRARDHPEPGSGRPGEEGLDGRDRGLEGTADRGRSECDRRGQGDRDLRPRSCGIQVTVAEQPTLNPSNDGIVLDQDPLGDSQVDPGSTVTITVGKLRSEHFTGEAGPLRVAVLMGGRSSEHDVSLASARAVATGLAEAGFEPVAVEIARNGDWNLSAATPEALFRAFDVVFPVLHGPFGEDGTVQGLLELADIAYVGAGVAASAVAMDKDLSKRSCATTEYRSTRSVTLRRRDEPRPRVRTVSGGRQACAARVELRHHDRAVEGRARTGLELAFAHDEKVLVEEFVAESKWNAASSETSSRSRRRPGRSSRCSPIGTTRVEVRPGRHGAGRPARIPATRSCGSGGRRQRVPGLRLRGDGSSRLLRPGGRRGGRQRAEHDSRIHGYERLREVVRGLGHRLCGALRRLVELAVERHERRADCGSEY